MPSGGGVHSITIARRATRRHKPPLLSRPSRSDAQVEANNRSASRAGRGSGSTRCARASPPWPRTGRRPGCATGHRCRGAGWRRGPCARVDDGRAGRSFWRARPVLLPPGRRATLGRAAASLSQAPSRDMLGVGPYRRSRHFIVRPGGLAYARFGPDKASRPDISKRGAQPPHPGDTARWRGQATRISVPEPRTSKTEIEGQVRGVPHRDTLAAPDGWRIR